MFIIAGIIAVLITSGFIGGYISGKGSSGANGINGGKLAACGEKNNCVSSQASNLNSYQFIEPWTYTVPDELAMSRLIEILQSEERAKLISVEKNYIRAEFTSRIFRFVDDVEFYMDRNNKKIHFRSSSRIGRGDWGVNRKRMEQLHQSFGSN
jgi:uncharacterized protein (DUF1499 family)